MRVFTPCPVTYIRSAVNIDGGGGVLSVILFFAFSASHKRSELCPENRFYSLVYYIPRIDNPGEPTLVIRIAKRVKYIDNHILITILAGNKTNLQAILYNININIVYSSYLCRGICGVLDSAQRHRVSQWQKKKKKTIINEPKIDVETRKRRLVGDDDDGGGVENYGKCETQRRRLTTIRDSRKTAVDEHLYMKWGTLRATVVERGRRRRAWTRERREFYRAHCPVFPTTAVAVDFSAQTIYRLGRRPLRGASRDRGRPFAANYFSAVPFVFRRLPPVPRHCWKMRVYRLFYPEQNNVTQE